MSIVCDDVPAKPRVRQLPALEVRSDPKPDELCAQRKQLRLRIAKSRPRAIADKVEAIQSRLVAVKKRARGKDLRVHARKELVVDDVKFEATTESAEGTEARLVALEARIAQRHGEEEQMAIEISARRDYEQICRAKREMASQIRDQVDRINMLPTNELAKQYLGDLQDAFLQKQDEEKLAGKRLVELGRGTLLESAHCEKDATNVWVVGNPVATDTARVVGGTYYHGAFVTGRPLHLETWINFVSGDTIARIKVTAEGSRMSVKFGQELGGATHHSYVISGSSIGAVNGHFVHDGMKNGFSSFINSNGIALYRATVSQPAETRAADEFQTLRRIGAAMARTALFENKRRRLDLVQPYKEKKYAPRLTQLEGSRLGTQTTDTSVCAKDGRALLENDVGTLSACSGVVDIPNISLQTTSGDQNSSARRIISTSISPCHVPTICKDWILFRCAIDAKVCRRRHFYISAEERREWSRWRSLKEQKLDANALDAVLRREALLAKLRGVAEAAGSQYLENDRTKSSNDAELAESLEKMVAPVLAVLDELRAATVETTEAISEWRNHFALQRRKDNRKDAKLWIATIETFGSLINDTIAPVKSKYKKYQRGEIAPNRARVTTFLGVFSTSEQAKHAYDSAKARVALRRRVLVQNLPPRVERKTFGGVNVIEMRGSHPLVGLESAVRARVQADEQPLPTYFYEQESYLVKMATDLDWLSQLIPLRLSLKNFPLEGNPLSLSSEYPLYKGDRQFSQATVEAAHEMPSPFASRSSRHERKIKFGLPSTTATRHGRAVSWNGESKLVSSPFETINGAVLVLDVGRVRQALDTIQEEYKLNQKFQVDQEEDKVGEESEGSSASQLSEEESTQMSQRFVWAVYENQIGEKVMVRQARAPLAGVEEGVFCNAEYGKWKGVGNRGPAAKRYWLNRRSREEANKRKLTREKLAQKLRRETGRGMIRLRPEKVLSLLEDAKAMHGAGRLVVDVKQANLLLERRYRAEILVHLVSKVARGMIGRSIAKNREKLVREELGTMRQNLEMRKRLAKLFVEETTARGVARAARKIAAPSHVSTTVVNGIRCYVLVYSLDHETRVSGMEKCGRIATAWKDDEPIFQSRICHHVHSENASSTEEHDSFWLLDAGTKNQGYYAKFKRPSESLRISLYDPATQEVFSKRLSEETLRKTLVDAEVAEPKLFKESSCHAEIRRRISSNGRWEPVREERLLSELHDDALRHKMYTHRRFIEALVQACMAADDCAVFDTALEKAIMRIEDAESHVYESRLAFQSAIAEAAKSLKASKEELKSSKSSVEDWRESSDPFEDGQNLQALLRKRKCELRVHDATILYTRLKSNISTIWNRARVARQKLNIVQVELERAFNAKERSAMDLEAAENSARRARSVRVIALNAAISMLTLRRGAKMGAGCLSRELVFRSLEWSLTSGAEARAMKPMRRFWNAVFRKVCTVRVKCASSTLLAESCAAFASKRYFITLSQDPVEGTCLFVAERSGADPGERVELVLEPAEVVEIVSSARRSDLALPRIEHGPRSIFFKQETRFKPPHIKIQRCPRRSLAYAASARTVRAEEVSKIILDTLHLDVFDGRLRIAGVSISRRRHALQSLFARNQEMVALGRPCGRWWLDSRIAKRSFVRGLLVTAKSFCIANRNVFIRAYDSWGDLLIETYEQKTGDVHTLTVSLQAILLNFLEDKRFLRIAQLLCSVSLNDYPASLLSAVLEYLDFSPGDGGGREDRKSENTRLVFAQRSKYFEKSRGEPIHSQIVSLREMLGVVQIFPDAFGGYMLTFSARKSKERDGSDYAGPVLVLNLRASILFTLVKNAVAATRAFSVEMEMMTKRLRDAGDNESNKGNEASEQFVEDPDFGIITDSKQRHNLFKFLIQRLDLRDEKQSAPELLDESREGNILLALEALKKFERWTVGVGDVRAQDLIPSVRDALMIEKESLRTGTASTYLTISPLPLREGDHILLKSSLGTHISQCTAQVFLNARGDFVISMRREDEVEKENHRIERDRREMLRADQESGKFRSMHTSTPLDKADHQHMAVTQKLRPTTMEINMGKRSQLQRNAKLLLATLRVARPLKHAEVAALLISANLDIDADPIHLRRASFTEDIQCLISASEYFTILLAGTLRFSGAALPPNTVLYACDWNKYELDHERPRFNERATRLCAFYAQDEESNFDRMIYGDVVFLCHSEDVIKTLIRQDKDLQEARKACRAARHLRNTAEILKVEAARDLFVRQGVERVEKILPWLQRAFRSSEAVAPQKKKIFELRAKAESVSNREDPFEERIRRINNENDAEETLSFSKLKQLQSWQLWRAVVIAHACQCRLPLAACSVPECANARSAALASGIQVPLSSLEKPDGDVLFPRGRFLLCSNEDWRLTVAAGVCRSMEAKAVERDICRRDAQRSKKGTHVVGSEGETPDSQRRQEDRRLDASAETCDVRKPRKHLGYRDTASFANALSREKEVTRPAVRLLPPKEAKAIGHNAAVQTCKLGETNILVSRQLVSQLVSKHVRYDARGSKTGATQSEILNEIYSQRGNEVFFGWLISRVSLTSEEEQRNRIGRLRFDATHGRADVRLSMPSCLGYVKCSISIEEASDGAGIIVRLDTVEDFLSVESLALTPHSLRDMLPSDEEIAATTGNAALLTRYVSDIDERADLAAWLLQHAHRVFYLKKRKEGGVEACCIRLRCRRHIFAAMIECPPDGSQRRWCLPEREDNSDDDEALESEEARRELVRLRIHLERRKKARDFLVAVAYEWTAIAIEDRRSHAARPLLAAPMRIARVLEDNFFENGVTSQEKVVETDEQLEAVLRDLFVAECEGKRSINSELSRAKKANPFPITMFAMAAYWREAQEESKSTSLEREDSVGEGGPVVSPALSESKRTDRPTTDLASLSSGLIRGFFTLSRKKKMTKRSLHSSSSTHGRLL